MNTGYPPTNKPINGEKVLIAMNGGVSSTVAAYLLSKQGYECIGLALNFFDNNDKRYVAKATQLPWVNQSNYKIQNMDKPLFGRFHIEDMDVVKLIVKSLKIDFFAVNAQSIYFDQVTDKVVSAKLAGFSCSPLVDGSTTIFDVLVEKAEKLGCSKIATGHYAKILHNKSSSQNSVYTSNDLDCDQSYLLAKLNQKHLAKLILPLAEMRKTDVEKIGKTLGISFPSKESQQSNQDFMEDPRLPAIVENFSAQSFREEGDLINYMTDITSGSHEGIHQYYIGQTELAHKYNLSIDNNLAVIKIIPSLRRVVIADPKIMFYTHLVLDGFMTSNDYDTSRPLKVYVKHERYEKKISGLLKFKNNGLVIIDLDKKQEGTIPEGEYIALYNIKGKGGRLIGSGRINRVGFYYNDEFRLVPSLDPELDDLKNKNDDSKPFITKLNDNIHHF